MSAAYHVGNILRTAHGMYTLGKYAYKFSRWGYKKLSVKRKKSGKWVIPKTKNLRGYKAGEGQTKLNLRGSTGPRIEGKDEYYRGGFNKTGLTYAKTGWRVGPKYWVPAPGLKKGGYWQKTMVRDVTRKLIKGNAYKAYFQKFKPYKTV